MKLQLKYQLFIVWFHYTILECFALEKKTVLLVCYVLFLLANWQIFSYWTRSMIISFIWSLSLHISGSFLDTYYQWEVLWFHCLSSSPNLKSEAFKNIYHIGCHSDIYIYVYVYINMCMYACMCMCVCMYVCMYVWIDGLIYVL